MYNNSSSIYSRLPDQKSSDHTASAFRLLMGRPPTGNTSTSLLPFGFKAHVRNRVLLEKWLAKDGPR